MVAIYLSILPSKFFWNTPQFYTHRTHIYYYKAFRLIWFATCQRIIIPTQQHSFIYKWNSWVNEIKKNTHNAEELMLYWPQHLFARSELELVLLSFVFKERGGSSRNKHNNLSNRVWTDTTKLRIHFVIFRFFFL